MEELVRSVIGDDIPRIKELLTLANRDESCIEIKRLGGMTNHSYKVTLKTGEELLVRIPGEGTDKMINRLDERKSTELACKLGIDSELLYFGNDGTKVMSFIRELYPMSEEIMRKKENILQAARIFYKLHTSGVDTGVRFEVFEMADLYEKIIRDSNVPFYDDYEEVKSIVMSIKALMDKNNGALRVPCHNDSLVANWILDRTGKLYLIDWEYSGMNEPMWDLSCLSIEANYTNHEDRVLLDAYYGRTATADEKERFIATKLYVDYLWTLWGLTRVPFDGEFMQEYANRRYERLKININVYKNGRR